MTTDTLATTDFEVVIGLEVHSQLLTKSKMFCTCSTDYANAAPNTHVCPVCMGMPGVLPVINEQAVAYTIMTALALNCSIPEYSKFDRKNYPYPDLMKGYQISQYDLPICINGWLEIDLPDGSTKRAGITRVHMEEGSFRCDANISLRPRGQQAYGNRTEVKNMNSFSAVFRALEYEIKRQAEL